jgi:hypothetical protein
MEKKKGIGSTEDGREKRRSSDIDRGKPRLEIVEADVKAGKGGRR